jgi:hypothetical protein
MAPILRYAKSDSLVLKLVAEQYDLGIRWSCKNEKTNISHDHNAYIIVALTVFL